MNPDTTAGPLDWAGATTVEICPAVCGFEVVYHQPPAVRPATSRPLTMNITIFRLRIFTYSQQIKLNLKPAQRWRQRALFHRLCEWNAL
jgi:hypothetical protein